MALTLAQARKNWNKSDDQIVKNIKIVLAGADMTQAQLSEYLGCTAQTLRAWMKHPSKISMEAYRMILYVAETRNIPLNAVL